MFSSSNFGWHARIMMLAATLIGLSATQVFAQHYTRTDLTADMAATSPTAPNLDPNLVNAWGISRSSGSPFWISDNGAGVATLYNGSGAALPLVVKIPSPDGSGNSTPTGTVWNYSSTSFLLAPGKPAIFMFVTEDGTISGWNPGVNGTNAVVEVNRSGKAIYKGCALARTKDGVFLYATNFKTGRVEVFDSSFKLVRSQELELHREDGRFRNFVPFDIQNVGGNLVVTFAHRQPGSGDEDHGAGLGFVGIYNTRLHLISTLQYGSWFNAPWGVALAPSDFGPFSHRLLISNFGDGTIHAFNALTGEYVGAMLNPDGSTLAIDGLWGLSFGSGVASSGLPTELFFSAGPNDENDGVFGKLSAAATEQLGNTE
jgi:uncharacterized protein (TIGR03118 family)